MLLLAPRIEGRNTLPVNLRRVERRLPAARRIGGRIVGTNHVPVIRATVITGKLEIDEDRNTGFDSAWTIAFRRDQSCRCGENESPFDFIEILTFIFFEWNRGVCGSALAETASPESITLAAEAFRKLRRLGYPGRSVIVVSCRLGG